jgi:hypothetical protein
VRRTALIALGSLWRQREYGGWGWQLGRRQRFGAIFRGGEALEVTRGDGRRFVVTVDAAAEAAALLTTLTDPAHR